MTTWKGNFNSTLEKSYIDSDGKKRFRFIVSSNDIDRAGDTINVAGIDLKEYMRNPVVLYNHNSSIIIGESIITKENGVLYGDVWFDEVHDISKKTKQQVEVGTLKTASIGLEVYEASYREMSEREKSLNKRNWIKNIRVIDKSNMIEWSVVPLPMNVRAELQRALDKDLELSENVIKAFENLNIIEETLMDIEEKAGAKISNKNKQLLQTALENIKQVLEAELDDENKNLEMQVNDLTTKNAELQEQLNNLQTEKNEIIKSNEIKRIKYEDYINNYLGD